MYHMCLLTQRLCCSQFISVVFIFLTQIVWGSIIWFNWVTAKVKIPGDKVGECNTYPPASKASRGVYWNQAQKNFTHQYTEYPWVSVTLANKPPIISAACHRIEPKFLKIWLGIKVCPIFFFFGRCLAQYRGPKKIIFHRSAFLFILFLCVQPYF